MKDYSEIAGLAAALPGPRGNRHEIIELLNHRQYTHMQLAKVLSKSSGAITSMISTLKRYNIIKEENFFGESLFGLRDKSYPVQISSETPKRIIYLLKESAVGPDGPLPGLDVGALAKMLQMQYSSADNHVLRLERLKIAERKTTRSKRRYYISLNGDFHVEDDIVYKDNEPYYFSIDDVK